jgi:acyl-CoA thioesterase-1
MIRRFLSAVVVASVAIGLCVSLSSAAAGPPGGTYLALGDSLAVGVGATVPARQGYVAHVFRFAHAQPSGGVDQLVNLAVPGETSRSLLAGGQLERAIAAINDPSSDVRLVTLDIGGNDFLSLLQPGGPCAVNPNTTPACTAAVRAALATFPATYATILTRLTQALATDPGDERLLVMTYYNPYSGTANTEFDKAVDAALVGSDGRIDCAAVAAGDDRVGLNDLIACIGAQFGATTVDVYPAFSGRGPVLTHIGTGDIHPTNAGYTVIAQEFLEKLL